MQRTQGISTEGAETIGAESASTRAYEQTGMFGRYAVPPVHDPSQGGLDKVGEVRGDVVLLCDVTGVIVGAKQPPFPDDQTMRNALLGTHLEQVIGKIHLRALRKMLDRRPWASVTVRHTVPPYRMKRCRVLVRTLADSKELLVVIHGLDLERGEVFTAISH